jgi:ubiquinone biosynthesis monooxygenase Coq7
VSVSTRSLKPIDRLLGEIGKAINVLGAPARAARPLPRTPGTSAGELVLDAADRRRSARLMRVNHAGEVAAQALYRGQALTARNAEAATAMSQAAAEEIDHLAWCEQRITELGGRVSVLNPLWYAGSFFIGSLAGALGDRTSLGFLSETERQVESHLQDHLDRLPAADARSRAIVTQMQHDEIAHGAKAETLGAAALPRWVKAAMRLTSRLMTRGSYWL